VPTACPSQDTAKAPWKSNAKQFSHLMTKAQVLLIQAIFQGIQGALALLFKELF